jgi:hypothetical protein
VKLLRPLEIDFVPVRSHAGLVSARCMTVATKNPRTIFRAYIIMTESIFTLTSVARPLS